MYKIDDSTAATTLPAPAVLGTEGYWTHGNPPTGTPATVLDQDWFNSLQQSLIAIIDAVGLAHSKTSYTVLLTAIKTLQQRQAMNYALDTGVANAYVAAYSPAVTAHQVGSPLRVLIANSNTGAATFTEGAGVAAVTHPDQSALVTGDLIAGQIATFTWDGTEFQLGSRATTTANVGAVAGTRSGFAAANDATNPNTAIDFSGVVALTNPAGQSITVTIPVGSPVITNCAGTGVNGLDTGSLAASTGYFFWLCSTGAGAYGLATANSGGPAMPAGHTTDYKALVYWNVTDASSHFLRVSKKGYKSRYINTAGTNTTPLPTFASGTAGSTTTPTYATKSLAGLVSPSAVAVSLLLSIISNTGAAGAVMVAPNANYGASGSLAPPPFYELGVGTFTNSILSCIVEMFLESMTVYYASSAANSLIQVYGWEDPF